MHRKRSENTTNSCRSSDHRSAELRRPDQTKQRLYQAADRTADEIDLEKIPFAKPRFHRTANIPDADQIADQVHRTAMHELKREQLPDKTVLQAIRTQGQFI